MILQPGCSGRPSVAATSAASLAAGAAAAAASDAADQPPDVFCGLGSLIVEGRLPISDQVGGDGGGRGYREGPHVPPPPGSITGHRHECHEENYMVR